MRNVCPVSAPLTRKDLTRHRRTASARLRAVLAYGVWALFCAGCVGLQMPASQPQQANNTAATVEESAISVLQHQMSTGELSAQVLAQHYLDRIEALDRSGPGLNSVIEINPDALAIAAQLDAERKANRLRGPLHGISVLIKDNIDTADAMLTTAGSLALMDSRADDDAYVVKQLRRAGAVILGKTNLSEWANFRGRGSTGGWSARGGQTRNPYLLDRSPSGSSSGSAVAVAAGLVSVAIGTETNGSIVSPASVNGIVGIKPTLGLVSRTGIIPLAAGQDTAGPMARNVADAAALLTVLAGHDPADAATDLIKQQAPIDYTLHLNPDSLKGARIGILRKSSGFQDGVDALFEVALAALRLQGAVIVDPVEIVTPATLAGDASLIMRYEFKDGITRYLARRRGPGPKSLAELIAFNESQSTREMPYFGQSYFLQSQAMGPLTDSAYLEASKRARETTGPQGIDASLQKDQLDALIAPTRGPAGLIDRVLGDYSIGGSVGFAPAVAGYPHITVPMGQVHGLPVGLSFVGTRLSEAKLIGYAYAFEQASRARLAPGFKKSLE